MNAARNFIERQKALATESYLDKNRNDYDFGRITAYESVLMFMSLQDSQLTEGSGKGSARAETDSTGAAQPSTNERTSGVPPLSCFSKQELPPLPEKITKEFWNSVDYSWYINAIIDYLAARER